MPKPEAGPAPGRLRILFASAEFAPLLQTGGLGDAVAGLAAALAERGHEVTCLLPGHRRALAHAACPRLNDAGLARIRLPDRELRGPWRAGRLGQVRLQLLDLPELYDRDELYLGHDEGLRFVVFSRAVAARAAELVPDVLVAHDWHAGLALCALRTLHAIGPARSVATVQVVHNGAHQGRYPPETMLVTGLPAELFQHDGLEFHGDLSLLKGGLAWADRIVAVSPSYARELQTPEFGEGLEGLYRYRSHRLVGIANGIDTERHDPARDPALPATFDARRLEGRALCRKALVDELALEAPEPGRLLVAIGRLATQKGWDVIADAIPSLIERGASLALLGDGDPEIALRLRRASERWPRRVAVRFGWDEPLARRLYAGSDCVLVPSRFEPCGLVQLLAQRYGSLPVAHRVGGLGDTIRDLETGVLFEPLSRDTLVEAAERAAALFRVRGQGSVVRSLLEQDVSWRGPAALWERLLGAAAAETAGRA